MPLHQQAFRNAPYSQSLPVENSACPEPRSGTLCLRHRYPVRGQGRDRLPPSPQTSIFEDSQISKQWQAGLLFVARSKGIRHSQIFTETVSGLKILGTREVCNAEVVQR